MNPLEPFTTAEGIASEAIRLLAVGASDLDTVRRWVSEVCVCHGLSPADVLRQVEAGGVSDVDIAIDARLGR